MNADYTRLLAGSDAVILAGRDHRIFHRRFIRTHVASIFAWFSQRRTRSSETVTYQYDSLNRLLSASSNQSWSETYGYDGFGNLLSKTPTGGAPTLSQSVNAATNQVVGQNYDSNGNQTSSSTGTLTYDAENRVLMAASAAVQYGYDSRNKRVWSATISNGNMTQFVYFYGVDGQKLGNYQFANAGTTAPVLTDDHPTLMVYFAGKRVATTSSAGVTSSFTPDRLGSNGSYYPYGEARGTVPQDDVGFATYTNDSATGLQYADQRYYANNFGRFMSPDPYKASAGPNDPGSWNRYTYILGDPTNYNDRTGRCASVGPRSGDPVADPCDPCPEGACDPCPEDQPGCTDPPPIHQPEPLQCSITLYSRGTPRQLGGPGEHTYIDIVDPYAGLSDILEGVPTRHPKFPNPFGGNWGDLFGDISGTLGANVANPLQGDDPTDPNQFVASDIGGSDVCSKALEVLFSVEDYNKGVKPPYRPVPSNSSGTYNSNSFTYTVANRFHS